MNEGVEYLVKLSYIKKIKLPVYREQKLAVFFPIFQTTNGRGGKEVLGKVEVRARVYLPEFLDFAKRVGLHINLKGGLFEQINLPLSSSLIGSRRLSLIISDDLSYLRLMVYGVVMSYLKTPSEWDSLGERVLSMEPIELRFWTSKFRNAYWKYKSRRILNYLAKRFLEVERI